MMRARGNLMVSNYDRLVRQEEFILEVTEALAKAMKSSGCSKAELAKRLGVTRGLVSQIMAGGKNLTLRTVADVAAALGVKPRLEMCSRTQWTAYTVQSMRLNDWREAPAERARVVSHPSAKVLSDNQYPAVA